MPAKGSYNKQRCHECKKETWHYTLYGLTKCCVHESNLRVGDAKPTAQAVFIDEINDKPAILDVSRDSADRAKADDKVYPLNACPKGFHKVHCATCNAVTMHYKSEGPKEPASCNVCNHAKQLTARHDVGLHPIDPSKLPLSPGEHRRLNRMDRSMWRASEDHRTASVYVGDYEWAEMEIGVGSSIDPDKNYCSFCGRETPIVQLLTEKKPTIRKRVKWFKNSDDLMETSEQINVNVETVKACPTCSLNIRQGVTVRTV